MTRSIAFAIALVFALGAALWTFETRSAYRATAFQYDFVAFYCASAVASQGADPYRVEPLRSCEHRVGHAFRPDSRLVVPAPLPGYALALLAPFARLPFGLASALWLALLIGAYALTVRSLARLTKVAAPLVVAATLLPLAALSLLLGQLVPLAIAALCLAAEAVEDERWLVAAGWVALAMIEPHLALPAIVALFAFRARMRLPLIGALALLGVASFAFVGFERNFEYLTQVLPAQVASEIARDDQLAPISLLYRLGLGAAIVAQLGTLTFLLATTAGVVFGGALARRFQAPAALVFIPPAIALAGAPYLHPHHLAAAIPAALFLVGRVERKTLPALALVLLSVPFVAPYDQTPFLPLAALAVAMLAHGLFRISPARAIVAGCAAFAALAFAQGLVAVPIAPPSSAYVGIAPDALAQTAWQILVAGTFARNAAALVVLALPAWLALLFLVTSATNAERPKDEATPAWRGPARPRSFALPTV